MNQSYTININHATATLTALNICAGACITVAKPPFLFFWTQNNKFQIINNFAYIRTFKCGYKQNY